MQFDAKSLTVLVFVLINLSILFFVKTRTSLVISVIIAHLVAVLFFSISIANYNSFREITLALIVYSMVILFLISNYGLIVVETEKKSKRRNIIFNTIIYLVAIIAFYLVFLVIENIDKARDQSVISDGIDAVEVVDNNKNYEAMKHAQMRDKLLDNFLFKRSSDVILITVAAGIVMLLLSKKE